MEGSHVLQVLDVFLGRVIMLGDPVLPPIPQAVIAEMEPRSFSRSVWRDQKNLSRSNRDFLIIAFFELLEQARIDKRLVQNRFRAGINVKEADSICQKLIECSKKERKLQIKDDV